MSNERYANIKEAVGAAQVARDHGLKVEPDSQGQEKALCPWHKDRRPSLKFFRHEKFKCFPCDLGGDSIYLEQLLGGHEKPDEAASELESRHHLTGQGATPRKSSPSRRAGGVAPGQPGEAGAQETSSKDNGRGKKKAPKIVKREEVGRWMIRGTDGEPWAQHVRYHTIDEQGKEGKSYSYHRPDGSSGLGGMKVKELPLYLSEQVSGYDPDEPIVLAEGEKAADAALAAGLQVVATASGTSTIPIPERLEVLSGREVILWPDADPEPYVGQRHMADMAEALEGFATRVRWYEWGEAPPKGDAADHPTIVGGDEAEREELIRAIREAPDYKAAIHRPAKPGGPSGTANGGAAGNGGSRDGEKLPPPGQDELRDQFLSNGDYAYGLGTWRLYESGVWGPVDDLEVRDAVSRVCEANKADTDIKVTINLVNGAMQLAQARAYLRPGTWDADPDLLVCAGGTLEISSRRHREHRKEDYITHGVPYEYAPDAEAPTWEWFMEDRFDSEVADFLQEFAGYCLTTDVSHEIAVWLQGERGGGRSTFLMGLEGMLGSKAGTLGLGQLEKSQFALADVPGKTLLTATEQPESYASASYLLNQLVSGDKIAVERKHRDTYNIYPVAKLLWAMNTLPRVPSAEDGLFRRVKVIEMPPAPKVKDPQVKERIKMEKAGILNWALDGLKHLTNRGHFAVPESVAKSTAKFAENNDIPALFVKDACVRDDGLSEAAAPLYEAYRQWCRANGHIPQSATKMASEWERLGFIRYRSNGKSRYRGVALTVDGRNEYGLDES